MGWMQYSRLAFQTGLPSGSSAITGIAEIQRAVISIPAALKTIARGIAGEESKSDVSSGIAEETR